jgi:DNA-binding transcriptional ArsR family regulator
MATDPRQLKEEAMVFKAMAHPSRLAVVEALAAGERCVCELQELVGSDMSTVSRHLSVLKQAGVIADSKRGTWVYYSLALPCVMTFLECLRHPEESSGCARHAGESMAGCISKGSVK